MSKKAFPKVLSVEYTRGQIPLAGVRQDDHDGLAGIFRVFGSLYGGMQRRAGGNAGGKTQDKGRA